MYYVTCDSAYHMPNLTLASALIMLQGSRTSLGQARTRPGERGQRHPPYHAHPFCCINDDVARVACEARSGLPSEQRCAHQVASNPVIVAFVRTPHEQHRRYGPQCNESPGKRA